LTRENENLRLENADLVAQMEAFGHWWKGGRQDPEIIEKEFDPYAGKDYEIVEIGGIEFYKDR
jgi:hypothetical protein